MKLGFFTMPIHPLDKDWRHSLREDREAFLLADQLGFAEGYVGEHATDRAENITSCAMFIASLVDATRTMRLGTGTVNMPNTHPVATASQIAMLDHMLDGRLSSASARAAFFPTPRRSAISTPTATPCSSRRSTRCSKIWTSEPPYDIEGKYWNIKIERHAMPDIGQGFLPRPLQRPHPPIVVTAVAPFSKGVTEAAARGWDPISANFLMPDWVATHWGKYAEGCQRVGRPADPRTGVSPGASSSLTMPVPPRLRDRANSPYRYYYSQLLTKLKKGGRVDAFKARRDQPDAEVTLDSVCDALVIHGSAAKVVDEILSFRDYIGDFGTLLDCRQGLARSGAC